MLYIILLILLILSGWFSGMEIALFSLSSGKVKHLVLAKKTNAQLLQRLLNNKNRLLVVVLLGNNLVNIGAASLATLVAVQKFGSVGVGIATGIMTILILIFGEMYPKAFFHINAVRMGLLFAPAIYFLQIVFYPVVISLEKLLKILTRGKSTEAVSEREFKALSRLAVEKGVIGFEEHEMIMNVLNFNDKTVKDLMTPFYKVSLINDEAEVDQVSYFVAKDGYSRYPVYHNQKDNIVGYIHVMDIMKVLNSDQREDQISKHVNPILVVKETRKIDSLFSKMVRERIHMAIVKRGDGQVVGLVTMEDLLEEIMGEIEDEND